MQIIRTGVTRTVILIGPYAIKIPSLRGGSTGGWLHSFCQGVLANQSERAWHDYEGWRGSVAPVLHSWLGGIVQVYPRCEPIEDVDDYWAMAQPEMIPDPGDHKASNWGLLDRRYVRVDYVL